LGRQKNSRAALDQATIAAGNVINIIKGKALLEYVPQWGESSINLTLGLVSLHPI
jgi:hypothetical protein